MEIANLMPGSKLFPWDSTKFCAFLKNLHLMASWSRAFQKVQFGQKISLQLARPPSIFSFNSFMNQFFTINFKFHDLPSNSIVSEDPRPRYSSSIEQLLGRKSPFLLTRKTTIISAQSAIAWWADRVAARVKLHMNYKTPIFAQWAIAHQFHYHTNFLFSKIPCTQNILLFKTR